MSKIQRFYEVALRPTEMLTGPTALLDSGIVDDGWYEPTTVSLWYDEGAAPAPLSPEAMAEVERRAIKLEHKRFDTPTDRKFEVEVRGFLRERLITPKVKH